MIAAPPFDEGALQLTVDAPFCPDEALTLVGAPGGPTGVIDGEDADVAPVPTLLVAVTVKV